MIVQTSIDEKTLEIDVDGIHGEIFKYLKVKTCEYNLKHCIIPQFGWIYAVLS